MLSFHSEEKRDQKTDRTNEGVMGMETKVENQKKLGRKTVKRWFKQGKERVIKEERAAIRC